jgi:hypothetical protein
MKTIFLDSYRSPQLKQRSVAAHALVNNDDDPAGGATPAVLPVPVAGERIVATAEQRHRPWLIQGMRNAL